MRQYDIIDIDYFEKNAFLVVNNRKFYFRFSKKPNLKSALEYFFHRGELRIDNGRG